jgi:SPP1 gp7 family putative phage head morphogenesis protein
VAVALNQAAEQVPLTKVGGIVADHARDEAWRVIGLKASDVLPLGHVVDEWRIANARLIKGMTDEMLGRVRDTLEAYDGSRVEDTRDELQATFGMTKSRAALIARDQTLKLNANITEDIHASVGITEYYWSTSKDSSVRKDHQVLEGVLCKYADPPVVDSRTQARGNPGTYFQCRCVPIPRLPETEQ